MVEVIWILCPRKSFVFDSPWQNLWPTMNWHHRFSKWPTLIYSNTQHKKAFPKLLFGLATYTAKSLAHCAMQVWHYIDTLCPKLYTCNYCYYLQSTWAYWYWKEFSCGQTFGAISHVLLLYIQVVTNGPTSAIIQGLSCKSGWGLCSQVVVQMQGLLYVEKKIQDRNWHLSFFSGTFNSDCRQHKILSAFIKYWMV